MAGIRYRADVFEKAGIKGPPATWDEALEAAKELTVSTAAGKQYGFTTNGKRGIYSSTLFGQVLFSYGGNWLAKNNAPTLTTPEAEAALGMIEKLMKYADPSVVNSGDNETINAMASGVAVYSPNAWGNNAFTRSAVWMTFAPGWRCTLRMMARCWPAQPASCAFSTPSMTSLTSSRRIGAPFL